MNRQQIKELLAKYDSGQCSMEERDLIRQWYMLELEKQEFNEEDPEEEYRKQRTIAILLPVHVHKEINWKLCVLTTAAILVLGVGAALLLHSPKEAGYSNDINPGTSNATLTLGDGRKIILADVQNGPLASQAGIEIIKTANGQLTYAINSDGMPDLSSASAVKKEIFNVVETPKGGEYQINLPDGTKVWLNAASKLTYPASFNGREERRIVVSGEAYFEVTKNKSKPFIVVAANQEIKVLGTHFNVTNYAEDASIKTTLLKGSVVVTTTGEEKKNLLLKPGEQAIVNNSGRMEVSPIDTDSVIAWKNGEFAFRNESLESIMQRVARWYDVDLVYGNKEVGKKLFGGIISRYGKISEVLSVFERTGNVKFKIEDRTVTIND